MKINVNGVIRDMTPEELKVFEDEKHSLENNKVESDISERLKRLEEKTSGTSTEITSIKNSFGSLQNAFGAIKETLEGLRNLKKL